jgi:hypothetical protein
MALELTRRQNPDLTHFSCVAVARNAWPRLGAHGLGFRRADAKTQTLPTCPMQQPQLGSGQREAGSGKQVAGSGRLVAGHEWRLAGGRQRVAGRTQHAAHSTQHAARSTQHAARSTQHAARSTQHAARSTQRQQQTQLSRWSTVAVASRCCGFPAPRPFPPRRYCINLHQILHALFTPPCPCERRRKRQRGQPCDEEADLSPGSSTRCDATPLTRNPHPPLPPPSRHARHRGLT